jgi:hypothetical protein
MNFQNYLTALHKFNEDKARILKNIKTLDEEIEFKLSMANQLSESLQELKAIIGKIGGNNV